MEEISLNKIYLLKNKTFIYPTSTVFGLGTNIFTNKKFNLKQVKKIYDIKGRNKDKPLSVNIANISQINLFANVNKKLLSKLKKIWPNPITIIIKAKTNLPYITKNNKIAIIMHRHPVAKKIAKELGPIIATSANRSGLKPINSKKDILTQKLKVDYFINGRVNSNISSTIIDLEEKKVIRKGVMYSKALTFLNKLSE